MFGSGDAASRSVRDFIDWAGPSTVDKTEDGRSMIAAARDNPDAVKALSDEVLAVKDKNHSRALLALSILGEMRSPYGDKFLRDFVHLPLPESGTMANGEVIEQTALATLQAKAIDGLAYLHNETADREVLWAMAKHPSRIVRAEAIEAYLWNHNYSREARARAGATARREEQIFLDRPRRVRGETQEAFNSKLEIFLKAHPEVAPPVLAPADRLSPR
jgi:hypothetical protein